MHKGFMKLLVGHAAWVLAISLTVTAVILVPALQRGAYWLQLSHQNFAMAALALALTPILLTGGIDLSVGSMSVLVSVISAVLAQRAGWPVEAALAAGALAGLAAGLGNAVLVLLGIPALVATLATRELYRGLAFRVYGDTTVASLPEASVAWWGARPGGLPVPLYGLVLLLALTYLVVHHTWIGRMTYAIGDNEEAARFAAVPVKRIKLGLYAWAGLVSGLCGVAAVLEYRSARPESDASLELAAIACVVLGGIRVTGGAGHVAGTVLGILTLTTLLAAVQSVSGMWRDTLTGALLLVVAIGNEAAARWVARGSIAACEVRTMFPSRDIFTEEVEDGGLLTYIPEFYSRQEADTLFASLLQDITWKQERGRFNRLFPRLTALYADPGLVYKYSGVIYPALDWTPELDSIRRRVETAAGAPFNSVLLNRYRDGDDSMGYHADAEPELGVNPIVPSLSLGAMRRFLLKHKKKKLRREFDLGHGSLLIMAGTLQHFWVHSLPKTTQPVGERINLTFRNLTSPASA